MVPQSRRPRRCQCAKGAGEIARAIPLSARTMIASVQRAQADVSIQCRTQTTLFVWNGDWMVQELRAGSAPITYVKHPDNAGPLAKIEGGKVYHYVNDHLGTPQEIHDGRGQIVWAADTSAYGKTRNLLKREIDNPIRFPGQYYDAESGLHYNRFRYYDPMAGRYINQDPIGLRGGLNQYAYANGRPLMSTDPLGLDAGEEACVSAWTAGGAAVGGVGGNYAGGAVGGLVAGTGCTLVAPGAGTAICGVGGATAGSYIGIAGGTAAGGYVGHAIGNLVCSKNSDSKSCKPPVGTKCYEGPDTTHDHAGLNPHYHIYQMFYYDNACRWKYLGGKVGVGVLATPTPGMLPCSSYPGFQGR